MRAHASAVTSATAPRSQRWTGAALGAGSWASSWAGFEPGAGSGSWSACGSGSGGDHAARPGATARRASALRKGPAPAPPIPQTATTPQAATAGSVVRVGAPRVVGHVDHAGDLGHLLAERGLDPLGERHPRHGAALAAT